MGTYCQLVCKASGSLEHSHPPSPSSEMTSSVTSSRSLCLEQSRPGLPCPALGSSLVHFQYNKPSESLTTLSSSPSKQFFFFKTAKEEEERVQNTPIEIPSRRRTHSPCCLSSSWRRGNFPDPACACVCLCPA